MRERGGRRERGRRERERLCVCVCWRRGKGFKDPDKASGRVCPSQFILSKDL